MPLNGDEFAVFTNDIVLSRSAAGRRSAQFLDYLVQLVNVDYISGRVDLNVWYTGGGLHNNSGVYSKYPEFADTVTLNLNEMGIASRNNVKRIPAGGGNLGLDDGAWFVYVQAVGAPIPGDPSRETVSLLVGRALGGAAAPMYDGNNNPNTAAPTPWYLKRFYVDGHEYNVTALITAPVAGGDIGFKAITIRTPVPKEGDRVNSPLSQVLQGYLQGTQFGVDTRLMYVMPPFNQEHTIREDIRRIEPADFARVPTQGDPARCLGIWRGVGPLQPRLNAEAREPRFAFELRELPFQRPPTASAVWSVEQYNTLPDQFTDIGLPQGQYYLLTSDWRTDLGRFAYSGCQATYDTQNELAQILPIPAANAGSNTYYQAAPWGPMRFQFWYLPEDNRDIYVNPAPALPIEGKVTLQGQPDGTVQVSAGPVQGQTDAAGKFTILAPPGVQQVTANQPGYLSVEAKSVLNNPSATLPSIVLPGGDAYSDNAIGIFDLVLVAANYGLTVPPADPRADLNHNGRVDLPDLVLVGNNFGLTGPINWLTGAPFAEAAKRASTPVGAPKVSVAAPAKVKAGETFEAVVRVQGAAGLSGAEVALAYNPSQLELLGADNNPARLGNLFDPNASFVARNTADVAAGEVRVVATPLHDARPMPNDEVLFTVRFRARTDSLTQFKVTRADFVDAAGGLWVATP